MQSEKTSPARTFLSWDKPLVEQAIDLLVRHHQNGDTLDLSGCVLLLPGRKAGRLMLHHLSLKAEELDLFLLPPQSVTLSALPTLLCTPEYPFSDDVQQLLSWSQALATSDKDLAGQILAGQPRPRSLQHWIPLAKKLRDTWNEIGSCGFRFMHIAEYLRDTSQNMEARRWAALQEIFEQYRCILHQQNLSDPSDEFLRALEHNTLSCTTRVYAIGMPDIPRLHRRMLEQSKAETSILIYAPEHVSSAFDSFGCLNGEAWFAHGLSVQHEALHFTHSTSEQADVMRHLLAKNIEQAELPAVSIISLDRTLLPSITRTLAEKNIALRTPLGISLPETPPCVLLSQLGTLAKEKSFVALATIVRNPCIGAWKHSTSNGNDGQHPASMVSLFDEVHNAHLPTRFDNLALLRSIFAGDDGTLKKVSEFTSSLHDLFAAFLEETDVRTIEHWCQATASLLLELYPASEDAPHVHAASIREIFSLLSALRTFSKSNIELSAEDFIAILLEGCATRTIAEEPNPRGIDLEGWLDILFSDCTHTCVLGFNEENIPQKLTPGPFLNEQLRRHIDAMDAEKRFARDSYLLHAALQSKSAISVLASRYNAAGEALLLSRLLLQEPREILLERLHTFFTTESLLLPQEGDSSSEISFQIPRFQRRQDSAITLSATQLRDYLDCPFRYYLKHILRLERIDNSAQELDQRLFGSLAHSVLQEFAKDEMSNSSKQKEIARTLSRILDTISRLQFGEAPRASIKIQIEQLRVRLGSFSHWQAQHRKSGWKILKTEHQFSSDTILESPSASESNIHLRGVIDRIDVNEDAEAYLVLDYKTGDKAKDATTAHRLKNGTWVNLQLPLYVLYAQQMLENTDVSSGYINLGADTDANPEKMLSLAPWSNPDLQEARAEASAIAQSVQVQEFWPPSQKAPRFDSFAELFPLARGWFANE